MIRRLLARLTYALLGLFVVFSALLYALAGTAPGSRWLLDTAVRLGHLPLRFERTSGSLLGGLDLYGIAWHDAAGELRIARARLRWRPLDLFVGKLKLDDISAAHILLVLPAAPAQGGTPNDNATPHIFVPFGIDLARLQLRDIVVVRGAQAWRLASLTAGAALRGDRLRLRKLDVATPQGGLQAVGSATLAPPYASALRLAWRWRLPDGTALAGQGRLDGNLDRIDLSQQLSAPFSAKLSGRIFPQSLRADLTLDWQHARWPLQGTAQLQSRQGQLHLQGTASAYTVQLHAQFDGPQIPTGNIALNGRGDTKRFAIDALHADTLGGRIDGTCSVAWSPALAWQVALTGSGIDPATQWPEWPGRLAFALSADGTPTGVRAKLDRLAGNLRGFPFSANVAARWQAGTLFLDHSEVQVGGGHLQARGTASAARGDLAVDFDLPRIANLFPAFHGSLNGTARLSGPWHWPRITARLHGRQLAWRDIAVAQAGLDVAPAAGDTLRAALSLDGLRRGTVEVDHLQANVAGDLQRQRIRLGASARQGAFELTAAGGFATAFSAWSGQLTQLRLMPNKGTIWQLSAPAALELGSAAQRLGNACLRPVGNAAAGVCLHVHAAQGSLDAAAEIRALPLALLGPWLPSGIKLAGLIDGNASVQGPLDALGGQLQARLANGSVTVEEPGAAHTVRFSVPQLQAALHDGALAAHGRAELPDQHARIDVATDIGAAQAHGARSLRGSLQLDLPQLSALQPFVPQLQGLAGKARAQLALSGTLAQPQLAGDATLSDGSATVVASGTRLEHVQLQAQLPPGRDLLAFRGSAAAGGGTLQANGQVTRLLSGQPKLAMEVDGKDFRAVDLPQVVAVVSPRLSVAADPARITVRGKVGVQQAKIRLQRLPAQAVSVSPDAEIVGRQRTHAHGPQLDAEIELALGDQVSIDALGLNGKLSGNLLVRQQGTEPAHADGSLNIANGTYTAYGLNLALSRGVLNFAGPVDNPGLDIVAERQTGPVTAKLTVTGTLKSPRSEISAEPPMSQADALSWLLTGHGLNAASPSDVALLLKAVYSMNVADNGGGLTSQLEQRTGLNEISVQSSDTLQQSALVLGKYLTPDIYVRYTTGLFERSNTLSLTYRLTRHLSAEARSGAAQALDLLYQIDFGKQ